MKISIFTLVLCMTAQSALSQQTNSCLVELQSISEKYIGDCKNSKADGTGKASGTDSYEGEFKKGYPDGAGTYTWQNGNYFKGGFKKGLRHGKGEMYYKFTWKPDSVVTGYWKKGSYTGLYEKPYEFLSEGHGSLLNKIVTKQGVKRNYVHFIANRDIIKNFMILNGSYYTFNSAGSVSNFYVEFQDVKFPFRVQIGSLSEPIDVIIYEEGDWEVNLTFAM
jgi:hypothetical protein